jgi:hypothetical protein
MKYPDIEHLELGTLRYENEYDWYEGQIGLQESDIAIQLLMDEAGKVAPAIERASNLVRDLEKYAKLAKEYAAQSLLEIKNEAWVDDENEEPLTPVQFEQRMTLESLSIDPNGEVSFYHNDGDLFWGHCILVTMDSENNFIQAETAG